MYEANIYIFMRNVSKKRLYLKRISNWKPIGNRLRGGQKWK